MSDIFSKPFKLYNSIQHYDWGTKNENAFIPKLIGISAEKDKPYAELWIGAHPKASSEIEIDGDKISLNIAIEKYPKEILGEYTAQKFNGKFPFLLKVLSAAEALSIQTHPNKEQAKTLHAKDPKNYPDDNHKPEIAIAIDSLTAVAGFRPIEEIITNLKNLPELEEFIGKELLENIFNEKDLAVNKINVEKLYSAIMKSAVRKELLDSCINNISIRLKGKTHLALEENQFIKQFERYGSDVGLLSFFFFNLIELKSNQAIFTNAGVPHAYLKGNIIECMANSDNVVRAGLTEKFKDVDTLLDIIKFDFNKYDIINPEMFCDDVKYRTSAEEFLITTYSKAKDFEIICSTNNRPVVYFLTNGKMSVSCNTENETIIEEFKKGESFIIPADLKQYRIYAAAETNFLVVEIP